MTADPGQVLQELRDQRRTARDLVMKGAQLASADLARLRADGLDLRDSNLRGASLAEVRWKGCILRDACLDAADLRDASLRLCELDDARARDASFVRARLENSTARGARLDGANFTSAVLTDTDFSRASLRGAILQGVSASGVDFRGADLRGAKLRDAVLVDADLRGADLTDADLQGADLRGADLRGAVAAPALPGNEGQDGPELPSDLQALSGAMVPIVLEVLRSAGRRGAVEPATLQRLLEEAGRHRPVAPPEALDEKTLKAVSHALDELGADAFPKLLHALQQPGGVEPPPEVAAMIRRLSQEFSLDDSATAEDVLQRLVRGRGPSSS